MANACQTWALRKEDICKGDRRFGKEEHEEDYVGVKQIRIWNNKCRGEENI